MTTTLVIANKLYSSWSMRPWLLLRENGIAFEEIVIPLRQPETAEAIRRHSPAGKVPVLVHNGVNVWDSLAICEYVAENWPEARVWPRDAAARALARSIGAEMHSGFMGLRQACPMNLGKRYAFRDRGDAVRTDTARVEDIWSDARTRFGKGGPFLFGAFTAADAMYAPIVTRFDTYGVPVGPVARAYMDAILALPSFHEWRDAALREPWVLDHVELEEPILIDHRRELAALT